ncbi:MAG: hypothetical protein KatS3mg060_1586 [Dehalococcoidia bacterium]|nr:MAG: hypothetical protein KatS3mg060_1586 [Dehalococcoidia bacterium]
MSHRRAPSWPPLVLLAIWALLVVAHLWIVTGGRWSFETNPSGQLYGKQAAAFRAGQLALLDEPPAALLAMADPYDPRQWRTLPIEIDVSLYQGRYYLYFGPLPALAMLLPLAVGVAPSDGMIGLGFGLLWLALLPIALTTLRRQFAPNGAWSMDAAAFIAIGLSAPVGAILGRLATYETAILAGQAMIMLALVLGSAANGRAAPWRLIGAGVALGLAAASRLTLLPAILVLVAVISMLPGRPSVRRLAALLSPFLLVLGGVALFNLARFGSPLETGWQYQLTALPQRAWLPLMFQPANLMVTADWYLFRPPVFSWAPPFVWPRQPDPAEAIALASWFAEPIGMVGVLWNAPVVMLGLGAVLSLGVRGRLPIALAGLWLAAIAAVLPVLLFRAAYFRYQLDFLPLLLVAAAVSLQCVLPTSGRWRGFLKASCLTAAIIGAFFGLASGIVMRNSRAGFAEADGLLSAVARRVPAVAAVVQALDWVSAHYPAAKTALIVEPIPATPATIDVGSPAQVDVVVATAADPCWRELPGPGIGAILSPSEEGAHTSFVPRTLGFTLGPTVYVAPRPDSEPVPRTLTPRRPEPLCPIAAEPDAVAEGFGPAHFRKYRTRAFWSPGVVVFQPVQASGSLVLRLTAHGAPANGEPPRVAIELRRERQSRPLAREELTIDQDWSYTRYERRFAITGTVYPVLAFEGPSPAGPWWAVAIAAVEAWDGTE